MFASRGTGQVFRPPRRGTGQVFSRRSELRSIPPAQESEFASLQPFEPGVPERISIAPRTLRTFRFRGNTLDVVERLTGYPRAQSRNHNPGVFPGETARGWGGEATPQLKTYFGLAGPTLIHSYEAIGPDLAVWVIGAPPTTDIDIQAWVYLH